ncbi:MAG: hypothetical protein HYZ53_24505 [Planctomycetes bacterium]|nr:hypothetical protein [Planctomycetota bacterium]
MPSEPRPQDLLPEERHLALALGIEALLFAGATLVFAFRAQGLLADINATALALWPGSQPIPDPPERFWLALALSMMTMITYIGIMGWRDVRRNLVLVPVLLLSKLCSSVVGVSLTFTQGSPGYLALPLSDFPIFLVTAFLYVRVLRAQRLRAGAA